jgi:acyl-CoA dehydrogenase
MTVGFEHPIGRLGLRGVRAVAVVGEVGDGFGLAMRTLDKFRVTVGAAAVGMARRAFDEARAHVTARVQFGAPLADTQLVQAHLADMACDLDAARLMVLRAALVADRGEKVTVPAAMAKLHATEAAQRVIDRAVQLFGGRGVCQGEVVEGLYRAIRPLRIYEGTSEIQRLVIGRAIARGST